MARLFDSDEETAKAEVVRTRREEIRRGADKADEVLKDYEETDAQSKALSAALSKARAGVVPIRYIEYREPGGKWMIEHSPVGDDYVFQTHPLRPPGIEWQAIVTQMIATMDVIFPDSIRIDYQRPNETYQMKFYTISVRKLTKLPGWKGAIDRALAGLSAVNAWPAPKKPSR